MKKIKKIILGSLAAAALLQGPFLYLKSSGKFSSGNRPEYDPDHTDREEDSILTGKRIIFLGSSVTYGSAANGNSFVEYLTKRNGILPYKEAVSGTTLVDEEVRGKASYIARLKTIPKDMKTDAFVCQLSTNDASLRKPLGKISPETEEAFFDTKTVAGAIEYVIAYAKKTWNCPVLFYTGTKYKSEGYERMVALLKKIAEKWDIDVLDLYNDPEMNAVDKRDYDRYMVNGIHPSMAGYRDWWTPKFEEKLKEIFEREEHA